jgi:hypothetical protein
MPIPASECPIIPKFIHVHNSYTISEDNYNELIELIRKMKSRNVAIFMRKSGLDDPAQPISEAEVKANEQEKEKESNEPKDDEDPDVSEAM